ncbi:hypothetical protein [Stenotrophomonas geniculata]|uniref:hypothetical protein n=1 Tax=Stenotrophomonas geniculata TaxID=86188 RepID=UPI0011129162|nr:hypothetical protein [Stenotrophomonas geniculata]
MSAVPPKNPSASDGDSVVIRRGRVESVDLYEIKDSELDQLEIGTQGGLHSTSATFLLSCALACGSSLASAEFHSKRVETVFMLMTIVGVLGGFYQGYLWWRSRGAIKKLCEKIRNRIAAEKVPVVAAVAPVQVACGVIEDGVVMGVSVEVGAAVSPPQGPEPPQPAG